MSASSKKEDALTQTLSELSVQSITGATPAVQKAIALARVLQARGANLQTPQERKQQRELERMMKEPDDRATLMQLTDQAFRSKTPRRVADQLVHILDVQGIPRFFSVVDRAMLRGFQSFGAHLPGVAVPMVKNKMREETANVVLPAESDVLVSHLVKRHAGGLRMNVNYLGEALLGEEDARRRLKIYLAALQLPAIDCISVKISTLYSQITPIARDHCVHVLCDRMELLYRAAAKATFTRPDRSITPKFVYLDMEEYRDLAITARVFMETLDRKGLLDCNAGIALQAYLPDSFGALKNITEWAMARIARGGSPVTIRIVKGANMEAERVEASSAGWPQAPYKNKSETDANYKRMLRYALEPQHGAVVRIGVASHNLFDLCYGLVLASERGALENVQFEMLEGIANHQRRALHELVSNVLLYAPATHKEDFVNAIGYLIRRLDENTGPENFLRHAFSLDVGSEVWNQLESAFVASCKGADTVPSAPRRDQDRNRPLSESAPAIGSLDSFDNEADTDFSLEQNIQWAALIQERWAGRCGDNAAQIPLVIAGESLPPETDARSCLDPSRPGLIVGRYSQARAEQVDRALACARADQSGWRDTHADARCEILANVGHELRRSRADLMGAAMIDGGKTFAESDPEVSEAIDFVLYYAASARNFAQISTVNVQPQGVVVVVSPWNFPIAIPCGGIAAALAAGNTVILKPASHTVLVAYELCKCFWRAGISKEVLQFVPCSGALGGARLVASPEVDVVVLTGGTETALSMLAARPDLHLLAETGGKNATIVTAMSDREQAIKHVVASAFGHAGQKCSATSLLILEAEVYDDKKFRETLRDAIRSIPVGSAHQLRTAMGPLISPPSGDLERAQKELEAGESWALLPSNFDDNPCLWSPGLKWGVQPGSYTHMTEFFGPVLAVMRADNLRHAIDLVNETGYGLTSGLESLDEREQEEWRSSIVAGNLYINRPTTGAIVLRQPFGGMGKSAFGPGIKAGGPNYVAQLMRFDDAGPGVTASPTDTPLPSSADHLLRALHANIGDLCETDEKFVSGIATGELRQLLPAIASYDAAYREEFGALHDHFRLLGQDNLRLYLPVCALRIRVHPNDSAFDIIARVCAAHTCGCRITLSVPEGLDSPAQLLLEQLCESWGAGIEFVEESNEELAEVIASAQTDRIRYAGTERVPQQVLRAVANSGIFIAKAPVLAEGRIELLWYLREQSISHDYHRYGNLGRRAGETRRGVL